MWLRVWKKNSDGTLYVAHFIALQKKNAPRSFHQEEDPRGQIFLIQSTCLLIDSSFLRSLPHRVPSSGLLYCKMIARSLRAAAPAARMLNQPLRSSATGISVSRLLIPCFCALLNIFLLFFAETRSCRRSMELIETNWACHWY